MQPASAPRSLAMLVTIVLVAAVVGYAQQSHIVSVPAIPDEQGLRDAVPQPPLDPYKIDLLDIGFEAATAMPIKPHLKSRSKFQYKVAQACFDLDQPRRALAYAERIADWRRGEGYAAFALYCAQRDLRNGVDHYVFLANDAAKIVTQDWQKWRISIKVAQTYAWLGDWRKAELYEAGTGEGERGKLDRLRILLADEGRFQDQVRKLDELIALGSYDPMTNAFDAYVKLYDTFYDDELRRDLIEEKIRSQYQTMPTWLKIDYLRELADISIGHGDKSRGLNLVNDAQAIVESVAWHLEDHFPLVGEMAKTRFRAGDEQRARRDLDAAIELYATVPDEQLESFRRPNCLRPLAEACVVMGDMEDAANIYRMTVEAGDLNPNARTRAEDLTETCISMALYGFEPDDILLARMRQIKDELGPPW